MTIFDWFAEARFTKNEKTTPASYQEREIPDGLWHKCSNCHHLTYVKDLQNNFLVCPQCNFHNQVPAPDRLSQLLDPDSWQEINGDLLATDPLKFVDRKSYSERLLEYRAKTNLKDAVVTGLGKMEGIDLALGVMDFRFMGGEHGFCRRGKNCPLSGNCYRSGSAPGFSLCFGGSENAGGDSKFNANG